MWDSISQPKAAVSVRAETVHAECRSSDAQLRRPPSEGQGAAKRIKLEAPDANGNAAGPAPQQQQAPPQQQPPQQQQPAAAQVNACQTGV